MIKGKVLLTGGTGSLGVAILTRAVKRNWPAEFTVFSRDEVKHSELRGKFPDFRFMLGDVTDPDSLRDAMRGQDMVIHAAAYKQVPTAEVNAFAAVKVNVLGSLNIARLAVDLGVKRVIGISTDKACAPVNLYGETKAVMEKLFQQAGMLGETQFNLCRYGNVLGSRGSVIPLFERQKAAGGPITFTDPDMTRFWLSLRDAVTLVELAARDPLPGSITVPKAHASTMRVLAEAIAPGVPTKTLGIRPGEKMHEQLIHRGESMHTYGEGEYFAIRPAFTQERGNLPFGYEYSSDMARQLTPAEIMAKIAEDQEG